MVRFIRASLIGLSVSIGTFVASADSNLPTCPFTGQKNDCYGSYTFGLNSDRPGTKYVGEWKDVKCHGRGLSSAPDASTYGGMFQNGLLNGQVTDGKLNGQATSIFFLLNR